MEQQKSRPGTEIKRVGKFGAIGLLNTLIDFTIFNLLSGGAGLSLVESNIISTTVAMVFSFFANKHLVFERSSRTSRLRQMVLFYVVTAFGLYVLQTGVIKLLTDVWPGPLREVVMLSRVNHQAFFIKNGAKAIGTVISLTWNYVMYKRVVFN